MIGSERHPTRVRYKPSDQIGRNEKKLDRMKIMGQIVERKKCKKRKKQTKRIRRNQKKKEENWGVTYLEGLKLASQSQTTLAAPEFFGMRKTAPQELFSADNFCRTE